MANGFGDGQEVPIDFALANAERIVKAVELPVTVDFEGGYATDCRWLERECSPPGRDRRDRLQFRGSDRRDRRPLRRRATRSARIAALRAGVGDDFFINAADRPVPEGAGRSDMIRRLADQAIERGKAYADAGDQWLLHSRPAPISRWSSGSSQAVGLPVNVMHLPNGPSRAEWASAGIARVSHGPFPYMAMQAWLERRGASGAAPRCGRAATICGRGPDLSTVLRNSLRAKLQDQRDPQRLPERWRARCGQNSGCCGGAGEHRHRRGQGERSRRRAPSAEFGRRRSRSRRKPKISTCAKVTGIDSVWTSRTVEACAPMVRKTAPSSR